MKFNPHFRIYSKFNGWHRKNRIHVNFHPINRGNVPFQPFRSLWTLSVFQGAFVADWSRLVFLVLSWALIWILNRKAERLRHKDQIIQPQALKTLPRTTQPLHKVLSLCTLARLRIQITFLSVCFCTCSFWQSGFGSTRPAPFISSGLRVPYGELRWEEVAEDSRDSALKSMPLSPWLPLNPCYAKHEMC